MTEKQSDKILLAHGGGGQLSDELIRKVFLPKLENDTLAELGDSAKLDLDSGSICFTTDSYVVKPLFFNGGDIQTELDAKRIRAAGAVAVQIETGGSCHLSAAQISSVLEKFPVDEVDVIIIENVGNLVCPSAFALGENGKIAVLSVAEGDDKPAKYPGIFAKAKAMLLNKIDLLDGGHVDFDIERAKTDARSLNKTLEIFPISAKTGEGMANWYDWLGKSVRENATQP